MRIVNVLPENMPATFAGSLSRTSVRDVTAASSLRQLIVKRPSGEPS